MHSPPFAAAWRPHPCTRPLVPATVLATLLLLAFRAQAQPVETSSPEDARPSTASVIEIKGQGLRDAAQAYSSSTLDAQQIRDAAVNQPEALFSQVPGVELRSYGLGGVVNVITVRGFSGGAHGGDLGMVIDGIPLNEAMSHSDGYADLNVIVPLEIERFQVFRGPVSALYGNFNRGGLVAIESRRGGRYLETDLTLGSFETNDLQGAIGTRLGGGQFNGAVQLYRTGDFRPDSKYTRGTASARWTLDDVGGGSLSLSARAHQGDWNSASYLLRSQFEGGDPYGKDPRVRHDGGSKHFATGRADYNLDLSARLRLLSFAYATRQDYTRYFTRPVGADTWSQREEDYERGVLGAGASLNGRHALGSAAFTWVAGAEVYRESTDYRFFEGTRNRVRFAPAVYDRQYDFNSVSAFTELALALTPWLRPTLGLRHDRYTGGCATRGPETGGDPCSQLNDLSRTTPKLGVVFAAARGLDVRASVAEGFALPPGVAKYAPGGAGLAPTVFRQVELGAGFKSRVLRADIATYRISSSNEVRTVSPGVYENFGRTVRRGTEASLTLTPGDAFEIGLQFNRMNARVEANDNPALVGLQVTGVPSDTSVVSLAWRPAEGLGFSAEWRRASDSAVNALNTVFDGGYSTLDLGLQFVGRLGGSAYRLHARLRNAGDRVYVSNAFVIGGAELVAPAPPRALQVGLQVDF